MVVIRVHCDDIKVQLSLNDHTGVATFSPICGIKIGTKIISVCSVWMLMVILKVILSSNVGLILFLLITIICYSPDALQRIWRFHLLQLYNNVHLGEQNEHHAHL